MSNKEDAKKRTSMLKRLREEAILHSDTAMAIECLSDAFEAALLHCPRSTTSGLVQQQSLFRRLQDPRS